jgi:uncharacterized protein YecE (DUF72 family)
MRLFSGTSGFSYKEWKGRFYPAKLPDKSMLAYYAERLPAVELNNTFYRMPQPQLLEAWKAQVPGAFLFALKVPRTVTHSLKLRGAEQQLERLWTALQSLGEACGPVLFQLPPTFSQDLSVLGELLALLPPAVRAAFEFRHASWFADSTYALLARHGQALCGGDVDDAERSPPLVATTSWGYLRLRKSAYTEAELGAWAARLNAQPWEKAFAFFKHDELGPELALRLNELSRDEHARG